MKRKIARLLIPLAVVTASLGIFAAPAQAGADFTVTVGSESCWLYGYYLQPAEARVRATSCHKAQARVRYITVGGSFTYSYGPEVYLGYVSLATAGTSMVTERAGRGAIIEGGTYWSSYKSYIA
jgi:hypothetical protein